MSLVLTTALASCGGPDPPPSAAGRPPAPTETATLRVVVAGIHTGEGRIRVAVYTAADGFPGAPERALRRADAPADSATVTFTFEGIPAGRCAVSVLHDANNDERMDTDFFGRPREGYGFSRDARGRFGPPGYDDAAVEVMPDTTTVEVHIQY